MAKDLVQEYLYLDRERLSAYVDQLRAPVTYDKVPVWSAELAISGPAAKAQQSRAARGYTDYEQLAFLEERLTANGQLATGRWDGHKNSYAVIEFRVESCLARRTVLRDVSSGEQLAVWVSRYNPTGSRPEMLLLFEDVRAKDASANYVSSFSWLVSMFMGASEKLARAVVYGGLLEQAADVGGDPLRLLSDYLAKNPLGFLRELGAVILLERSIRTLYRVRSACLSTPSWQRPIAVTLGYPVYIVEGPLDGVAGDPKLYFNEAVAVELSREEHEKDLDVTRRLLTNLHLEPVEIEAKLDELRRAYEEHVRNPPKLPAARG